MTLFSRRGQLMRRSLPPTTLRNHYGGRRSINELREPGTFVALEIFEQIVLVVAGRDGIRAFHNVCQHRGNRLVESRRGKVPMLTCGYHAWAYSLDGCRDRFFKRSRGNP